MHPSHITRYALQNRNVHIFVLNGAFLRDMGKVHCGICELRPLEKYIKNFHKDILNISMA